MVGPELGKAYVNIIPKAPGMKNNMQKLLDGGTPSASSNGQKIGNSMLSGLKSVFAAAAVGKVIKDAIDAGADLQQSYGGLDTIYGNAATAAKKYADSAALAGISANSYAEQAVSFGAALKQAYGGDTTKAMEAANTAIMDMADNSAKMGTPLESIQQAYQGFARQQYQLLDNLKLGYGGTQAEMKRLLADAEALTGVKYDISNLGDVYEAIHVIQEELGVAGVAALEARTTMTGSANAMKASWTNLMAAISTGHGLETALSNLGTTVGYFADNLIGMLVNISDTFPGLLQRLPAAITEFAPKLVSGGAQIVANLATGLAQAFPALVQQLPAMGQSILTAFKGIDWMALGSSILDGAVTGFSDLLVMLPGLVGDILTTVIENAPKLIEGGAELIGKLGNGVANAIPKLVAQIPGMCSQIKEAFLSVDWISVGRDVVNGIISGVVAMGSALFAALRDLASSALQAAKSALGIGSPSKVFANDVGKWLPAGMAVGIEKNIGPVHSAVNSMTDAARRDLQRASLGQPGGRVAQGDGQEAQPVPVQNVTRIEFTGDLAQLARVLQPVITTETRRQGPQLIT